MADSWDAFPLAGQPATTATATDWDQYPVTKPVSPDSSLTGQALSAFGDVMKGPVLTSAVRGLGGLADAAWDPYGTLLAPFRKLISPGEEARYQAGEGAGPGQKLGDTFFRATGIPEYRPTSAPERMLMAGGEGAVAGAPFGAGSALLGGLSGTGGQAAREAGLGERAATVAEMAPGALAIGGRALTPQRAEVPTALELQRAGSAGFDATRASPVEVARAPLHGPIASALAGVYQQYDPLMMPQTQRAIQNRIMQGGNLDFNDVINLRKSLTQIVQDNASTALNPGNAHEVAGASAILRQLDDHITNLGSNPQHIAAGTPAQAGEAAQTYADARANYAAAMRSNKIGGGLRDEGTGGSIMGAAQNRVEAANSGRNYDNILRSQIRQFMEKDSNLAGFSPNELAALDAARRGSFIRNRLRDVSNIFGGGPSLTSLASGGLGGGVGSAFGPIGAAAGAVIPPALGMVARGLENSLARGSINAADEAARMRSPLYQERLQNLPPRDLAIIRSVLPGLLAPPPQQGGPGLL